MCEVFRKLCPPESKVVAEWKGRRLGQIVRGWKAQGRHRLHGTSAYWNMSDADRIVFVRRKRPVMKDNEVYAEVKFTCSDPTFELP
jgi:hypothetical protein